MSEQPELVTITIDGEERRVPAGELLIKAAEDTGTYIPRFCWHPRMKSVGMCRICVVEVDTGRGPALIPACMNPVSEGMVVSTQSEVTKKAQEAVLEFLLANHPLDCPVCDKGGECPLQDQALSHGPGESRFVEIKRTFEKPIPISDLVLLDRERCILCDRCTRFSREVSGDPLIEFLDRGNKTQVNTFPDHPFSSYFSGNTVQICPVGALTAKPYRFRARPWDLRKVESSSLFDTAHPRMEVHASQNEILRFMGVDNDPTNQGWLSDKARFGFEYIHSENRLTTPLVLDDGEFRATDWAEAIDIAADRLGLIRDESGGEAIAVIGGAQGTNEDAYALSKFARVALSTNNVDCRVGDALSSHFLVGTVDRATIDDVDDADTILVWGPDLKEEHPTLYLRVRRAAQEHGARLVIVHPRSTGLDDCADVKMTYKPGDGWRLLQEIGDGGHPGVREALDADKVVALVGLASHADGPRLAEAVAAMAREGKGKTLILPLASRANTFGALDMGLAPDLLPGRVALDAESAEALQGSWGEVPGLPGRDTAGILEGLRSGEIRGLLLVGADPLRDFPTPGVAEEALEAAEWVVAIDLFLTDSTRHADVVLPAETLTEKEGTVTNLEGRVQKVNHIRPGPGQSRPDWAILDDLGHRIGSPLGLASPETISKEIADVAPAYRDVSWEVLDWDHPEGMLVPPDRESGLAFIPVSMPDGESGDSDLRLHVARTMYDDGVRLRNSRSLARLAPGAMVGVSPEDADRLSVEAGQRVRLSTPEGEGVFVLEVDEGTPQGTLYVPYNQDGAAKLGTASAVTLEVVT